MCSFSISRISLLESVVLQFAVHVNVTLNLSITGT